MCLYVQSAITWMISFKNHVQLRNMLHAPEYNYVMTQYICISIREIERVQHSAEITVIGDSVKRCSPLKPNITCALKLDLVYKSCNISTHFVGRDCIPADASKSTCAVLTDDGSQYIELVWTFPSNPSVVDIFQLVLSGTQPCDSKTTAWFVRGVNGTGAPSECNVIEELHGDARVCVVTCHCLASSGCGYLHFRVQFPTWMATTLALCHLELVTPYPGSILPEMINY